MQASRKEAAARKAGVSIASALLHCPSDLRGKALEQAAALLRLESQYYTARLLDCAAGVYGMPPQTDTELERHKATIGGRRVRTRNKS